MVMACRHAFSFMDLHIIASQRRGDLYLEKLPQARVHAPATGPPASHCCHVRNAPCTRSAAAYCVRPAASRAATISAGAGGWLFVDGLVMAAFRVRYVTQPPAPVLCGSFRVVIAMRRQLPVAVANDGNQLLPDQICSVDKLAKSSQRHSTAVSIRFASRVDILLRIAQVDAIHGTLHGKAPLHAGLCFYADVVI